MTVFYGKHIVITAGPTREKIDPVRFLSNYSSGKMGYALAKTAQLMGANVTLISGPMCLSKPENLKIINVESSQEMFEAVKSATSAADIFIGCAAVSDYKPKEYSHLKIKKHNQKISLELVQNIDIISTLKELYPEVFYVGFAAETNSVNENGLLKLQKKNLDMIAVNDVSDGKVFGKDTNELHVFSKTGQHHHLGQESKDNIAESLLKIVADAQ